MFKAKHVCGIIGISIVIVTATCLYGAVVPSGTDSATFTNVNTSGNDMPRSIASWSKTLTWSGSNGVYTTVAEAANESGVDTWLTWYYYQPDTGSGTVDGWRQLTLQITGSCTKSVSWAVDIHVNMDGTLNAKYEGLGRLGDAEAYGWAKQIVTGLGTATAETKGSPFHLEEEIGGDGEVTVASAIKVPVPIYASSDIATITGDDADSTSGTKPNAVNGDSIRVRGVVVTRALVWDGGQLANLTCKTLLPTFSLTEN